MTTGPIIMVQIADHQWNNQALYYACLLARRGGGKIAFVQMVPVQPIGWLGAEFGKLSLTNHHRTELQDCIATVEDYGLEYSTHTFQYVTLAHALLDAAKSVNASVVFARLPKSPLPFLTHLTMDNLGRQFSRQQRVLLGHAL